LGWAGVGHTKLLELGGGASTVVLGLYYCIGVGGSGAQAKAILHGMSKTAGIGVAVVGVLIFASAVAVPDSYEVLYPMYWNWVTFPRVGPYVSLHQNSDVWQV
jgi:hypothetical protein